MGMDRRICAGTRTDGEPCGGPAKRGTDRCAQHPHWQDAPQAAAGAGPARGEQGTATEGEVGEVGELRTAEEVSDLLRRLLRAVAVPGGMDPERASASMRLSKGYLASLRPA